MRLGQLRSFVVFSERPLWVNSVEKLCYTTARKFLGIFRLPGARITDQFCGSEMRQAGFSWDFYYPLITSVQKYAQIANKIVALFKSEFFNSIERLAVVRQPRFGCQVLNDCFHQKRPFPAILPEGPLSGEYC